jgi:hypothetical protein
MLNNKMMRMWALVTTVDDDINTFLRRVRHPQNKANGSLLESGNSIEL